MQVLVEIPVELEAIAFARDVVSRIVADSRASQERIEEARLLTSQVISDAMRRADPNSEGSIGLAIDVSSDRLRVEVTDQHAGAAPRHQGAHPAKDARGGWGFIFVAELSDRWGAEPDSVWFELSL
jgi:anti-sigma regulatory factor (Ser/Thr protein kinase)